MGWKYQLVIQFPFSDDDDLERFDTVCEFEDQLVTWLGPDALVDGHDAGAGEMNIFVHTNSPAAAFERIRMLLPSQPQLAEYRAAYRAFDAEEYVPLWPPGLTTFDVA